MIFTCFRRYWNISSHISIYLFLFILTSILASFHTLIDYNISSSITAIVRYNFLLPFIFISFSYTKTVKDFKNILTFIMLFITFAVLCYPYQYLFGEVEWFANAAERAGVTRFSTYLGSLPVNGAAFSLCMIIVLNSKLNSIIKILLFVILFLGILFSLQKTGIMSFILIVLYIIFRYLKKISIKQVITIITIIPLAIIILFLLNKLMENLPQWERLKLYSLSQIGFQNDAPSGYYTGDVSILQGIYDRTFGYLVQQSLGWMKESHGFWGFIIGGNYGMLGPALMPNGESKYITSHNGYVDFILVGGIIHLIAFCGILLRSIGVYWKKFKSVGNNENQIYLTSVLLLSLIGIQTIFGGGITFQPIIGGLFWILIAYAWRIEIFNLQSSKKNYTNLNFQLT